MDIAIKFERRKDLGENDVQRYLDEIKNNAPLSLEKEAELGHHIKLGNINARNRLVEANLRFVVSIALEYRNTGVPLGDLIAAGNEGLITAAERFDGDKGFKFISYAVWWIRQRILQALSEEKRTVRLPFNKTDLMRDIHRFNDGELDRIGRNPTEEEIAQGLDESLKLIRATLSASQTEVSIDANVDDERTFHEVLSDPRQSSPEESHRLMVLKLGLDRALGALETREAEILRLYFGLEDDHPLTLEEIGGRFGITRERVRQIKEKALRKLRHPSRAVFLEDKSREYRELFLSAVQG